MKVVIGSDHGGFELKEMLVQYIRDLGHEVSDVGTNSADSVDYTDFTEEVGKAVMEKRAHRGIMLCGSGVGASIAANKMPGIRAGLCHDTYSAHQGVEHDNINVLVLGGRVIGVETARELVKTYLGASFTNEQRHVRRLGKLREIAQRYGLKE